MKLTITQFAHLAAFTAVMAIPATVSAAPQFQVEEEVETIAEEATPSESQLKPKEELVRYLAAKMLLANQAAIQIAEVAKEQSETPEVQELAETIIRDHQALNEKLKKRMPAVAKVALEKGPWADQSDDDHADGPRGDTPLREDKPLSTNNRRRDNTRTSDVDKQVFDGPAKQLMKITRMAINNSLHTTRQTMGKYHGQDFDMAFLGYQISGHGWLISELQAVRAAGPEELREISQEASEMMGKHLQKAQQLARKYEDKEGPRSARLNN